jgi:hypothetical protein
LIKRNSKRGTDRKRNTEVEKEIVRMKQCETMMGMRVKERETNRQTDL